MSNKSKSQQQQQQSQQLQGQLQGQQQQQQQHQQKEPVPPRYQPPPQPNSGILKSQVQGAYGGGVGGSSSAAALNHHHQQQQQQLHQLQQQHQQQAARLASQVKDAVQSKFAQKVDLPHAHSTRTDKLQAGFGLQPGKGYLPSGIPTAGSNPALAASASGRADQPAVPSANGPSAAAAAAASLQNGQAALRQRITDEEFLRLGPLEMLKFVRKTESDIARLAAEQHRQIQSLINELRLLKEANQRLSDDNQELRDLCCFLDDDRQKGRKLAREWQRFGRYTASVMRQEVSAYQNKLRQLDNKQQELIKDNLELKELCLYLDEERGGGQRDDGDGSSSSTNADETSAGINSAATSGPNAPAASRLLRGSGGHHHHSNSSASSTFNGSSGGSDRLPPRPPRPAPAHTPITSFRQGARSLELLVPRTALEAPAARDPRLPPGFDQTVQYVRCLEQRVKQLEEDKSVLQARAQAWTTTTTTPTTTPTTGGVNEVWECPRSPPVDDFHLGSSRPEAVVRALQVLEVREQLEREAGHDGEKALVREMCNVVWRKLEEGPTQSRH